MKIVTILILVLLMVASTVGAQDNTEECQVSYLFNSWARATAPAAPNGAVFGQLVHIGEMHDTLVSASTAVAEVVEFHEMIMGENDVMQMRPVDGGFMVPPNGFKELKPGGFHIMLIGLTQDLVAGEHLELTLNFEQAGEMVVNVPIKDVAAMAGMDMGMEMESDTGMASAEMAMEMPLPEWDEACVGIHVLEPWMRPAIPGAPNSAAYGLLVNLTDSDERLVSASTDVAETVELHEMVIGEGDVMQMRPLESGIAIPAGGTALLQPGGLHMMLLNLTAEFRVGDEIDFGLSFMESGELLLSVPVKEPEMSGMDMGHE